MSPTERRFEQTMAWHCAPSLTGIKPADLVAWSHPGQGQSELLHSYGSMLARRGIHLRILGEYRGKTLLLVFRRERLWDWLCQPQVSAMLGQAGYPVGEGLSALLDHLGRRLAGADFPHEIGLFLGYPPVDVEGFLRDKGRNCKLCGPWKVYGDVEQARRRFSTFRRCRAALSRRLALGVPLSQVFPA